MIGLATRRRKDVFRGTLTKRQPMNDTVINGYRYTHSSLNTSHDILLPAVRRLLDSLNVPPAERRLFELGCGNGSVANALFQLGWDVTGVDPSTEGIAQAQAAYPELKLATGSAYDDLVGQYGQFPVVVSLEVVEHVYAPRDYAHSVFDLLAGGGHGHPVHALPRLLEEPRAGAHRKDGCALHRAVGPRPHQVLVHAHAGRTAARGRFRGHPVRTRGAGAGAGQVDDCDGAQALIAS